MSKLKVGDKVDYHSIIGEPATSTGHTIQEVGKIGNGKTVAWISGHVGCVDLDALTFTVETCDQHWAVRRDHRALCPIPPHHHGHDCGLLKGHAGQCICRNCGMKRRRRR